MQRNTKMLCWLRDLLCGFLIGAGGILPGVSGGVLAVIFGLYHPFMEILTEPGKAIPKYWTRFIPVIVGLPVGFLIFAKGISAFFNLSDTVAVWLFIGLIFGTVPTLFHEAGTQGRTWGSWISLAVCGAAMFGGLFYVSHVATIQVTPNFWWYNICGALLGLGVIIPGMTSSSIMMAFGLYEPMLNGLANLDIVVLSACLPGLVLTVILLARLVRWFFREHYAIAYHGILGIVLASILVIIPMEYAGAGEIMLSLVCCVGGFALARFMARVDKRVQQDT